MTGRGRALSEKPIDAVYSYSMQKLTDLREAFRVYALCIPCGGRMEEVDLEGAISRIGPAGTVADLRDRVRCRRCRRRTRDIRLVYTGPKDRPASFRYRR